MTTTNELYGALPIPIPSANTDDTLGDPALDIIAGFATAIFNFYGSSAWTSMYPAQTAPVLTTITNDPTEGGINRKWLPALFVWRSKTGGEERAADEYFVRDSTISLAWMPTYEPDQIKRKRRSNFVNAMHAMLCTAVRRDQDPSYITDGNAGGTLLAKALRVLERPTVGPVLMKRLQMKVQDGPQHFPYAEMMIQIREQVTRAQLAAALDGIDGDIVAPDATPSPLTFVSGDFDSP